MRSLKEYGILVQGPRNDERITLTPSAIYMRKVNLRSGGRINTFVRKFGKCTNTTGIASADDSRAACIEDDVEMEPVEAEMEPTSQRSSIRLPSKTSSGDMKTTL
ncbi:hypothetical protein BGZ65_011384 [Modicella reniformis]|uniref:Uncharacterized protein n=1 Tax=Modicella reniformis TaxID=1440133 RepID=A0A9P6IHP0_9FUNG|nr:hypothetical protein BGZ65_011384 [Modicella reniformis]